MPDILNTTNGDSAVGTMRKANIPDKFYPGGMFYMRGGCRFGFQKNSGGPYRVDCCTYGVIPLLPHLLRGLCPELCGRGVGTGI